MEATVFATQLTKRECVQRDQSSFKEHLHDSTKNYLGWLKLSLLLKVRRRFLFRSLLPILAMLDEPLAKTMADSNESNEAVALRSYKELRFNGHY